MKKETRVYIMDTQHVFIRQ